MIRGLFWAPNRWKIGLGRPLGAKADFGGPKALGDTRFGRPSWRLFGPKSASCGFLEPQEASWSVSRRSATFFFRAKFQAYLGPHFGSILDPKTVPKSLKNRSKIHAHRKLEKKAYFEASCIENSRWSDAEAKKADVRKLLKNIVFWYIFHILGYVKKAQRRCEKDDMEACRISTKNIVF